jgi:hypothetical protein
MVKKVLACEQEESAFHGQELNCGLDFEYLGQWQPPEEAATLLLSFWTGLMSSDPYRAPGCNSQLPSVNFMYSRA